MIDKICTHFLSTLLCTEQNLNWGLGKDAFVVQTSEQKHFQHCVQSKEQLTDKDIKYDLNKSSKEKVNETVY